MREKFTTTLTKEHKKKLAILAANNGSDKNEWIEKMIDIEWGEYINEVGNEKDKQ